MFYGGRISLIGGSSGLNAEEPSPSNASAPVCGPFSADFHWVTLPDCEHSPIRCTDGQAAIFQALWSFRGVPVDGDRVMRRAGLSSGKPNDLVKVKARYKGDPEYEGPLFAYRALVKSNRREGTYWIIIFERQATWVWDRIRETHPSLRSHQAIAPGDNDPLSTWSW